MKPLILNLAHEFDQKTIAFYLAHREFLRADVVAAKVHAVYLNVCCTYFWRCRIDYETVMVRARRQDVLHVFVYIVVGYHDGLADAVEFPGNHARRKIVDGSRDATVDFGEFPAAFNTGERWALGLWVVIGMARNENQ